MPVYGDWAFLHRVVVGQYKSVRFSFLGTFLFGEPKASPPFPWAPKQRQKSTISPI
jgi:hypothetical protein